MSLRKSALLLSCFTLVISVGILYLASRLILLKSYEQIEVKNISTDLQRVVNTLQNQVQSLLKMGWSYAQWDETRDYIFTGDTRYIENNLMANVYVDLGLDFIVLTNSKGEVVFQKAINRQTKSEVQLPTSLFSHLEANSPLFHQSNTHSFVSGFLSLREGNLILISLPISNNEGTGPINGYQIWGRFIDSQIVGQMKDITQLNVRFASYQSPSLGNDFQQAKQELTVTSPFFVRVIDSEMAQGYTVINDIFNQPALFIRVSLPRILYQQEKVNLNYFLLMVFLLTFTSTAITLVLLNHFILGRLRKLGKALNHVQATHDLSVPITITGHDELAQLADGIRKMLDALGQSRSELEVTNLQLEQRVNERTIQLERTKSRIEAIFYNSGEGIVLVNLIDGIQQSNPAFDQLFNTVHDTFFGIPLLKLVVPEERDKLQNLIERAANSQDAQRIEICALRADSSVFDAEISLSPFKHEIASNLNFVCIIRDISEQKRIQQLIAEERNLLRTLIDAIPDYIYIKDIEHRLILNNVAHTRTLGNPQSRDVIGKTDFELFPTDMATKFHADEDQLFATGNPILNTEERSIGQDGRAIWALTTKAPLRNLQGEIIGLVGITHDVSQMKANEEALRRSEERLQKALEREKELNELKSRFVSMASHEFRTPLTIINNNAYILQKQWQTLDEVTSKPRFDNIFNQISYLSQIIDEVLDLTRSESQITQRDWITADWIAFCVEIIDEFRNISTNQHQYRLTQPSEPIWVHFSPFAMRKVLSNLLSNAQKYSPIGSTIWITIEPLPTTVQLSIRDEGIGIPQEDQEHLFEAFHRAGNVGTIRGTGLGLVITKQAIEQHGGQISFVSQAQIGTIFTITLPLTEIEPTSQVQ